jgi:hypothetical protein
MSSISIKFLRPAVSGETVYFSFYANYPDTTEFVRSAQAVPTRINPGQFSTGATATLQAEEYYDAFVLDYGSQFDVSRDGDTVIISPLNDSPLFNASTGLQPPFTQLVQFTITNPIDEVQDIRARSPYLLISTTSGITFNSSVFTIRQFYGSILDYASAPISYNKTKQKLINGQDNIWINLSGLLKEDLEADVDYYQDADYTTARNLSDNESKWVYVNTVNQYNGSGVTTGDTFYFVVDGYIEPTDGSHDLPNVLKTGNKRYIYRDSNERIYFKTDNLTGATYSTPTVGPISISFTGDTDESYGYVKSVKVDNTNVDNEITYSFGYSGQSAQTITYEFYDECLYSNYDLVFKNKYGMLETLSMSKKSSKTLNIESTDYLRSIVNLEGVYNINRHTKKQFNVGGMEEWTLNTEMLPEYMNSVVKEAYLSEEMWLIDSAGVITPVIRKDQNVQFRTILNREMVQYTLVVTLSHNTIQNIQ